jgi:hypothetical protein
MKHRATAMHSPFRGVDGVWMPTEGKMRKLTSEDKDDTRRSAVALYQSPIIASDLLQAAS